MQPKTFAPNEKIFVEYLKCENPNDMKVQHYHDNYEVYLQVSGERTLILNGLCYRLRAGDLYLLRPFELHSTESRGAAFYERYLLNLPAVQMRELLKDAESRVLFGKLDSCVVHLEEDGMKKIQNLFQRLEQAGQREGFLAQKLLCAVALEFLIALTDVIGEKRATECVQGKYVSDEIITAIHYIRTHYREKITLDGVAGTVHLSRYHFCRLFHQMTGATFLEYLYNIRLSTAHRLLTETALPLSEIAENCGFTSTAHLTRSFRGKYGMAPGRFRRVKLSENIEKNK